MTVDLDYVQGRLDKAGDVRHGFVLLPIEDGEGMVAELRAARKVVKELRTNRDLHNYEDCKPREQLSDNWGSPYECDACRMVRTYDKAMGDREQQVACDRCTQGVMDADQPGHLGNDHLYARCDCDCHPTTYDQAVGGGT